MRGRSDYFAVWLTRTLANKKLPAGEVARALGVNDSAISRWKNGKAAPGLDSVMKLADFLDVEPVALAVTAGLMEADQVKTARLPLPDESEDIELARKHIMKIPGLTEASRRRLLATLEED